MMSNEDEGEGKKGNDGIFDGLFGLIQQGVCW